MVASAFDSLTLKTPYPVCQAKSGKCFSRSQRDEFVLPTRAISAAQRLAFHLADDSAEVGEQLVAV